jgi:hypothetical protein
MRFMLMLKGDPPADNQPSTELIEGMVAFQQSLQEAGVLLLAEGLHPSATGAKVVCLDGRRTVQDGPFAEAKELIAGFYLIDVRSRDEAVAWASRCPVHLAVPAGVAAEIEVRQVAEVSELTEATDEQRDAGHRLRENYRVG